MPTAPAISIYQHVVEHFLESINRAKAETSPFCHCYFEDLFPPRIYQQMLASLPDPIVYTTAAERHYGDAQGGSVRWMYALSTGGIEQLPGSTRDLWCGIAAALADPSIQRAVFTKLAPDLAFRYGIDESRVPHLPGHSRPTLYREVDGFEIPPHPDTRKKIVTMHLYLPADLSQIGLGTALYKRRPLSLPFGNWQRRFEKIKQFDFRPNSGYAFVVNNTLTKRSWHGRERLPEGAGIRNTLLNTFYAEPREGFFGYLDTEPARRQAA